MKQITEKQEQAINDVLISIKQMLIDAAENGRCLGVSMLHFTRPIYFDHCGPTNGVEHVGRAWVISEVSDRLVAKKLLEGPNVH